MASQQQWAYGSEEETPPRERRREKRLSGASSLSRGALRRSGGAVGGASPAERQLAQLQDAFVEAIENASANLVNRETSLELRSLSSISASRFAACHFRVALNMDELLSQLTQLRAADRQPGANKAAILSKINRARQDLVTTIRMEASNVVNEQVLVRQVLAFVDMDDSDASDSEYEDAGGEASVGFSQHRPAPRPLEAAQPSPPHPPALRAVPAPALRVQAPSFTPPPRIAVAGQRRGDQWGACPSWERQGEGERLSPTSVIPPPGTYTYFDKDRGELVTARLKADTPPAILVVPPQECFESQWDEENEGDSHNRGDDSFSCDSLLEPPSAAAPQQSRRPAEVSAPRARGRGALHAALQLVLAGALGVGVALVGTEQLSEGAAAGAKAAQSAVAHAIKQAQRAAAYAAPRAQAAVQPPTQQRAVQRTVQRKAQAPRPAAPAPPPAAVTEWQRTKRPIGAAPLSEAPDAVREVRWQPHVSLGRG